MAKRGRKSSSTDYLSDIVSEHVETLVAKLHDAIRQQVTVEIMTYFHNGEAPRGLGGAAKVRRRSKRVMTCIAPGCKNTSKGPRFHYLCDKHRDASKAEYAAWQAARKNKTAKAAA